MIVACTLGALLLAGGGLIASEFRQEGLDRGLISAVKRRDTAAVVSLLRSGANPNAVERPVIRRSFVDALLALLRGDVRQEASWRNSSALELAAGCSNEAIDYNHAGCNEPDNCEMVRTLVDHGARVNYKSQFGMTPLLEALAGNRTKASVFLIEKGADVRAEADWVMTHSGLWQSGYQVIRRSPELLQTAIAHGANVNASIDTNPGSDNGDLYTPIFAIMDNQGDSDTVVGSVRTLLSAGADPNHISRYGETPLMCAERAGPKAGRVLLDHGAKINLVTKHNGTVLHHVREALRYAPGSERAAKIKAYIAFLQRNGAVDRSPPSRILQ